MICSFCNNQMAKGTGFMYVLKDGTIFSFCSQKCKRNLLFLKREGRLLKWTNKVAVLRRERVEEKKSEFDKEIEKKLAEKQAEKTKGAVEEKKEAKPEKPK
jgi:large subunit ribosomal protein L24e